MEWVEAAHPVPEQDAVAIASRAAPLLGVTEGFSAGGGRAVQGNGPPARLPAPTPTFLPARYRSVMPSAGPPPAPGVRSSADRPT